MNQKAQLKELITEIEKIQNLWLDKKEVLKALKNIVKNTQIKYR
jgi:iron-sulfur cluster repair protein YtfE (RIC family)